MAWAGTGVQRGDPAAWRRLAGFRAGWYGCLGRWPDALFGLGEAVLCAGGPVTSLPRLSLLPVFGRGHGSVYAALAEGNLAASAIISPADRSGSARPGRPAAR